MSSPTKEELPKLANPLKTELTAGHQLRHADTTEKVVLPTAEDLVVERREQELLKGIQEFGKDNLKSTETHEKIILPTNEDIEAERKQ